MSKCVTAVGASKARGLHLSLPFLLLLPAFLLLALMVIVPITILFVFSLGVRDDLGRVVLSFQPGNYLRFFCGPYLACLFRSIVLSFVTMVSTLVIGYLLSYWLAFCAPGKWRNFLVLLVVLLLWTSSLLRIYAWITILHPTGLVATLAGTCFPSYALPPLLYTPFAVWVGMVYNYLPYMVLPLYTSIERLEPRLLEAAADLGASPLATLFRVLLPLTGGGIIAGSIMVFVPSLGDYVTPDLMGGAKTMFIGNLIQNQFLSVRDWVFGSAVSTILIALVSVSVWIYLRYAAKETIG